MERQLYRSRTDRVIGGVCGGLADYFQMDPVVVRVLAVLLAVVTQGGAVLVYLVMMLAVPEEPESAASGAPSAAAAGEGMVGVMAEESMGPGDVPEPGEYAPQQAPPSQATPPVTPTYAPYVTPQAPAYGGERHRGRGGMFGGVVLILIGVLFLANNFLPGFDFGRLWPLIVIAVGLSIMLRPRRD